MNIQPLSNPRDGQVLQCIACGHMVPAAQCMVDLDGKAYQAYYHVDCVPTQEPPTGPSDLESLFGEVISVYTREQALEDGFLVNLNLFIPVEESGYLWPVACTSTVWAIIDKVARGKTAGISHKGVIWDVLHMSRVYQVKKWENGALFQVKIGKKTHTLKIECGPGDGGQPVLTIMLPDES